MTCLPNRGMEWEGRSHQPAGVRKADSLLLSKSPFSCPCCPPPPGSRHHLNWCIKQALWFIPLSCLPASLQAMLSLLCTLAEREKWGEIMQQL